MLTSFRSLLTSRRPMLPEQILTVFIVPRFFHKSNVKSLRSVFRRRETKVERTLYSTITNPNKRSKSLFPRRRPPLLLKESECRSISGIIGSRFVAAPKNNSNVTSLRPTLSFLNPSEGHKHGVSILSSINLCGTFCQITRVRKAAQT